ncbi:hypothetical protein ['Santalum album' aster yellows phytoplasma]|uniref:Integral membrane protein n=1 Tax='Santalum album' aster yellows phytoplasma TaxID=2831467 RepID=A0ABS5LL53_9MOLU|nr:hypothetical protein ['Santalum album' aster yellows phytoplasma]MBS2993835.1 hypothetical protein ['Santalum album' aster yellows phytoplasma]
MLKTNNKETKVFFSPLQKHIIASILLGFTIVLEFAYDKLGIAKMGANIGSFIKVSLLPLILIGFLLGKKHSFLFCTLYALFHLFKAIFLSESNNILAYMQAQKMRSLQQIAVLLLDYLLVDLSYSLSFVFYTPNLKYFDNYKSILLNLLIVFASVFAFKCLASYFIWLPLIANKQNYFPFLAPLINYPIIWCFCYNLIPVFATFIFIFIFLFFLNPRIKTYLNYYR